jgi:pilus assembly protein Flp/PilA
MLTPDGYGRLIVARTDGYLMEPMKPLNRLFSKLLNDESGQDLIEYALVAALIGLSATAGMRALATTIGSAFTSIGSRLTTNV